MIVYFSGTGNSRYCAQFLAHKLGDELTDAFHFIRDGVAAELCSEKPWVFVSPTYGWRIPRVFEGFIRSGFFSGSREAYFVMTCGSEIGSAGAKLAPLCADKGLDYRGVQQVVMPENYVAMFPVPGPEESERIIAAARPSLDTAVYCVRRGESFPPVRAGIADRLKTAVVNPAFYRFCVKAAPFYATNGCIGCGKCESVCPTNTVRLVGGRPVWGEGCTHCMACICRCPTEAIEYGRASLGKPRYRCGEYKDG